MIETGGSAFPSHNDAGKEYNWLSPGMTMRDYFAAKIAQALAVKHYEAIKAHGKVASDDLCYTSYRIADGMIAARNADIYAPRKPTPPVDGEF